MVKVANEQLQGISIKVFNGYNLIKGIGDFYSFLPNIFLSSGKKLSANVV